MGFQIGDLIKGFKSLVRGTQAQDTSTEEPEHDATTVFAPEPALDEGQIADIDETISGMSEEEFSALRAMANGYAALGLKKDDLLNGKIIGQVAHAQDIADFGSNLNYEQTPSDVSTLSAFDAAVLYRMIEMKPHEINALRPSEGTDGETYTL